MNKLAMQNERPPANACISTRFEFATRRGLASAWAGSPAATKYRFSVRLGQFPQCFLEFGQAVDFRYNALQRYQRGRDVLKKVFMAFNQPEKTVRAQRLHQAL